MVANMLARGARIWKYDPQMRPQFHFMQGMASVKRAGEPATMVLPSRTRLYSH